MSRFIEALKHAVQALLRALGLSKRPLPTPPKVPPPKQQQPEAPTQITARFYGPFIPQWDSFEIREQVLFDFAYQVHGCGSTARKYGIKDPIKNEVTFALTIKSLETQAVEQVFTRDGRNVGSQPVSVDRLYWIPGHLLDAPPFWFRPKKLQTLCGTTVPPREPTPTPPGGRYALTLVVEHPNGQRWGWSEEVTVDGSPCK